MGSKETAEKYNLTGEDLQLYILIVGTRVVGDKVEEKFINLAKQRNEQILEAASEFLGERGIPLRKQGILERLGNWLKGD